MASIVITHRVMTCSELSKCFAVFEAFSEVITRSVMTTLSYNRLIFFKDATAAC